MSSIEQISKDLELMRAELKVLRISVDNLIVALRCISDFISREVQIKQEVRLEDIAKG